MIPTITEFSYGYSLTQKLTEILRRSGRRLRAAPIFPSLYQEGRAGMGCDVEMDIGIPIFLQFKLSHYMKRRNSIGYGLFNSSFYRISLMPMRDSNQHPSLLTLEAQGNEVDYVAPVFHRLEELNSAFLNNRIVQYSVFIRPSSIGELPNDGPHYIGFQQYRQAYVLPTNIQINEPIDTSTFNNRILAYRMSDPLRIEHEIDSESFVKRLFIKLDKEGMTAIKQSSLVHLANELVKIVEKFYPHQFRDRSLEFFLSTLSKPLDLIANLSVYFFNSIFVIVGEEKQ